jgi:hypothetical protein
MPNLEELINIQRLYQNSQNKLKNIKKKDLTQFINEGLDQNFIDKFDIFSEMIPYLNGEKKSYVVLLFIDICYFSKKTHLNTLTKLRVYLDKYYNEIIPLIHLHGGVVDKIMGDGIICLFGEPFLGGDLKELLNKAESCSHEILKKFSISDYQSKIAIHSGEVLYYKNKTNYKEFTMIGTPITELFRLEFVSENNAINYYPDSDFDKFKLIQSSSKSALYKLQLMSGYKWKNENSKDIKDLSGINYKQIKYAYAG